MYELVILFFFPKERIGYYVRALKHYTATNDMCVDSAVASPSDS